MAKPIRLFVADDHAIVRDGLGRLLAAQPGVVVCGEAADGAEAVARCLELAPDIVLMDIGMPGMDGIEATARIKESRPDTKILILTAHEDRNLVRLAMKAGASGYLLKNADRARLAQAIEVLMHDGAFLETDLCIEAGDAPCEKDDSRFAALTKREREILAMAAEGMRNREIADRLCISVKTVEKHRANLMKKLGLHSVAELVSFALKADFFYKA